MPSYLILFSYLYRCSDNTTHLTGLELVLKSKVLNQKEPNELMISKIIIQSGFVNISETIFSGFTRSNGTE